MYMFLSYFLSYGHPLAPCCPDKMVLLDHSSRYRSFCVYLEPVAAIKPGCLLHTLIHCQPLPCSRSCYYQEQVLTGDAIDCLPRDGHSNVILHTVVDFECAVFELRTLILHLVYMKTCVSLFSILQVTCVTSHRQVVLPSHYWPQTSSLQQLLFHCR